MSNSSNNSMNLNSPSKHVKSTDNASMSCSTSNRTGKRSLDEDLNVSIKKVKVDDDSSEQKILTPSMIVESQPRFVSAAQLVMPLLEVSDEELLEMALELERKYGY